MGHISLVSPVTNMVIFKNLITNLSKVLGISAKNLEDIVYLHAYVVIDNGLTKLLKKKDILPKKINQQLIGDILEEVVVSENSKKEIASQAKKLQEDLVEKKSDSLELNTVFLEDYLDFLEKH